MLNLDPNQVELVEYFPGVIGKITEIHATYYYEHWGFDISFETQVGKELSEFMMAFQPGRDGFWAATVAGEFAGAIAIDGSQSWTDGARLRWFIVVPKFHGCGIGSRLIREAMRFCREAGHKRVYLWTFKGLDAARFLYKREGFRLSVEHDVDQWGTRIKDQKFELEIEA